MNTLTEWATMTPAQRRESTRRKAEQYAAAAAEALGDVPRITISPDYSMPYVANGTWYVRMGTVDMPFTSYEDAAHFLSVNA